jgi:sugar lactone lactonase YvrE
MGWEFEMVAGPFNPRLTEGPAWDGRTLLFTHIPASLILRYDPETGQCTVFREHTNHTNGLAFDSEGRLYGCCSGGRSIVRFETDGTMTTIVDRLDGVPLNTPNDLAIDRQGRIWLSNPWNAGNIDPSERQVLDHNSILRADLQPDGTWLCKRMTSDTTGTNGLLISPDQRTLYMIQTSPERRELRAYDILEGETSSEVTGRPDEATFENGSRAIPTTWTAQPKCVDGCISGQIADPNRARKLIRRSKSRISHRVKCSLLCNPIRDRASIAHKIELRYRQIRFPVH